MLPCPLHRHCRGCAWPFKAPHTRTMQSTYVHLYSPCRWVSSSFTIRRSLIVVMGRKQEVDMKMCYIAVVLIASCVQIFLVSHNYICQQHWCSLVLTACQRQLPLFYMRPPFEYYKLLGNSKPPECIHRIMT